MSRFVSLSLILFRARKPKKKKVPIWKPPLRMEKEYIVFITKLVNSWERETKDKLIPAIPDLVLSSQSVRPSTAINVDRSQTGIKDIRLDTWIERLEMIMESLRISTALPIIPIQAELNVLAHDVNQWNVQQWFTISEQMLGTPLFQMEPWLNETLQGFTKENVDLITNIQQSTFNDIDGIVNRGIKQGLSAKTIEDQILQGTDLKKGRFKNTRTRAQLIARDQVDKLNGQLTQLRQTGAGLTRYVWRTMIDERVRVAHNALEGRICQWENMNVYKNTPEGGWFNRSSIGGFIGHPGQDYQCRCYAEPDFTTLDLEEFSQALLPSPLEKI